MTTPFSIEQQSIIVGSLLGDAHLSRHRGGGSNCYLSKSQCIARKAYLEWTAEKLHNVHSSINDYPSYCQGKRYDKSVWLSKAIPEFTSLRQKWYPEGTKVIPRDIKLDPLSIAIWFFDDGSNHLKSRCAKFATYCFSKDDCEFLCDLLKEQSIIAYPDLQNVIHVRTESYKALVDMVKPFMLWPFFAHKIQYRDSELDFTTDDEAMEIVRLHKEGHIYKDISEKVGKSISVISTIVRGQRMKHLGIAEATLSLKNTSGHKNVYWDKSRNKWVAAIKRNGKSKNLGRFSTKEEAILVVEALLV